MWFCVPHFSVLDASGAKKYGLSQPTCVNGMCVDVCSQGLCNCRIPFYIFNPEADMKSTDGVEMGATALTEETKKQGKDGVKFAQITKVWGGLKTELFTDADTFEVEYPAAVRVCARSAWAVSVRELRIAASVVPGRPQYAFCVCHAAFPLGRAVGWPETGHPHRQDQPARVGLLLEHGVLRDPEGRRRRRRCCCRLRPPALVFGSASPPPADSCAHRRAASEVALGG